MKSFTSLLLILLLSFSLFAQNNDSVPIPDQKNTRDITLEELYSKDSLTTTENSALFQSLIGANMESVKDAYKYSRQRVDSILVADSLNPNFWRVYSYMIPSIFIQANKSSNMAMAIFLPWFLLFSFIIIITLSIKTFFIRPYMYDAEKPSNDLENSEMIDDNEDDDLNTDKVENKN